jgi:hypothetical protein
LQLLDHVREKDKPPEWRSTRTRISFIIT